MLAPLPLTFGVVIHAKNCDACVGFFSDSHTPVFEQSALAKSFTTGLPPRKSRSELTHWKAAMGAQEALQLAAKSCVSVIARFQHPRGGKYINQTSGYFISSRMVSTAKHLLQHDEKKVGYTLKSIVIVPLAYANAYTCEEKDVHEVEEVEDEEGALDAVSSLDCTDGVTGGDWFCQHDYLFLRTKTYESKHVISLPTRIVDMKQNPTVVCLGYPSAPVCQEQVRGAFPSKLVSETSSVAFAYDARAGASYFPFSSPSLPSASLLSDVSVPPAASVKGKTSRKRPRSQSESKKYDEGTYQKLIAIHRGIFVGYDRLCFSTGPLKLLDWGDSNCQLVSTSLTPGMSGGPIFAVADGQLTLIAQANGGYAGGNSNIMGTVMSPYYAKLIELFASEGEASNVREYLELFASVQKERATKKEKEDQEE